MTTKTRDTPSHDRPQPGRGRRWFAFLGGAVAWLVHLLGVYLISEFGCVSGFAAQRWAGFSAVAWLLLLASLAPLLVAIAAMVVGYRDARHERQQLQDAGPSSDALSPIGWLSHAGWLFSGLFAITIAIEAIPALYYLSGC